MAVKVGLVREGVLTRPSHRTWQRDASLGANTLTIANGHTIDAMRFVTGDFRSLSAVVGTQAKQWLDTGTNTWLDVTAPDNILVSGWLQNGAVVSSHVAAIPYAGSGYRMEIYGRDGTLVASGEDSPQLSKVFLHGAQRGNNLEPIAVPERFTVAAPGTPDGEPLNVGQMYSLFARAIRGERCRSAGFRDCGRSAPAGRCDQAGVGYRAGGPFRLSRRGFFAATPTPTLPRKRGRGLQRRRRWADCKCQFNLAALPANLPPPLAGEGRVGVFGVQFRKAESAARRPDRRPHPIRRRRHLDLPDAERRQRVEHRIDDRRQCADRAGLARSLGP